MRSTPGWVRNLFRERKTDSFLRVRFHRTENTLNRRSELRMRQSNWTPSIALGFAPILPRCVNFPLVRPSDGRNQAAR